MIGKSISHYRIIEKLGEGGMGVVYKALDTKLDRFVALKFLPPELTRDPEARKRFIHEAQAASALDHTNVCTIYEIDETEKGQTFIAMACYEGETLREKTRRKGEETSPLQIEEAVDIAIQIAQGLEKAHKKGIVHRDIKPANIFMTEDGVVKILDFGLAKLADRTRLTKIGTTLGTAAYMSPEQTRGDNLDHRTDIWSLGVVMYEMVTGQTPFKGDYEQAVIYSILNEAPEQPVKLRKEIPEDLEKIILHALDKNPDLRYSSTGEISRELAKLKTDISQKDIRGKEFINIRRLSRKSGVLIPAFLAVLVLVVLAVFHIGRRAKVRQATQDILPRIEQLLKNGFLWENRIEAFKLVQEAEKYIPDDPKLVEMRDWCATVISINTSPPGVRVSMKPYRYPDDDWQFIGATPIKKIRVPIDIFYWKFEKQDYAPVLISSEAANFDYRRQKFGPHNIELNLDKEEAVPPGMLKVPGSGRIGKFYIDKHEVTNRKFKAFVDDGGYRNEQYWKHEFLKDGRPLSREQAMSEFRDITGRPGPSTWEAGDYPDGQDDYPVSGISWYEAAAYAEYAGKSLPTVHHWGEAKGVSLMGLHRLLLSMSNFGGKGPAPAGSYQGTTPWGVFDMAGNVREWCWNATQKGRCIRGGAWNDANYMFESISQANPFDRSSKNGFRCALYPEPAAVPDDLFQPIKDTIIRDYYQEVPISDGIFQAYKNQFLYDKTDLEAVVEETDESADDWIVETVTFNAAYGDERIMALLYLPKNTVPPFHTVVYAPGGNAATAKSIKENIDIRWLLYFILKNGRAVMYPVYKGTYERIDGIERTLHTAQPTHRYTEYLAKFVKDFKRSVDYLELRPDIDSDRLAYCGFSWGGTLGALVPAVEDRLKASVLINGAFCKNRARSEADPINYVSRVTLPTLMLNGKYDFIFPLETNVKPMYDLLGTPEKDKQLIVYETDHYVPRNELIKELLNWLDRYLGPVQ